VHDLDFTEELGGLKLRKTKTKQFEDIKGIYYHQESDDEL